MAEAGTEATGVRYRHTDVDGINVMVMVLDQRSLTQSPALEERVALAAKLCMAELRTDPLPQSMKNREG